MKRAALLIGVDKTGDLPRLKDAASGAALMKTWADAQGIDTVHLLTDVQQPVTLARIKEAIKALVKSGNVGQLLVYFAGHGVSQQRKEVWLLSDAPDDADEAVADAAGGRQRDAAGDVHRLVGVVRRLAEQPDLLALLAHAMAREVDQQLADVARLHERLDGLLDA